MLFRSADQLKHLLLALNAHSFEDDAYRHVLRKRVVLEHDPAVVFAELKCVGDPFGRACKDNLSASAQPFKPLLNRRLKLLESIDLVLSVHVLVADLCKNDRAMGMVFEHENLVAVFVNTLFAGAHESGTSHSP